MDICRSTSISDDENIRMGFNKSIKLGLINTIDNKNV